MTLTTVRSSAIHAIGYDPEERVMEIIFTGGGIYQFYNVPFDLFRGFLETESKGNFFQERIRGRFPHERLGRFRQRRRPPVLRSYPAS